MLCAIITKLDNKVVQPIVSSHMAVVSTQCRKANMLVLVDILASVFLLFFCSYLAKKLSKAGR